MNILNKKIIRRYDVKKFKFYELFLKHLKKYQIKNIENFHKNFPKELLPQKIVTVKNDQDHDVYKYLYKIDPAFNLNNKGKPSHFLKTYKSFVSYIANNIFKESLIFQKKPTFRIMLPNNLAVGGFGVEGADGSSMSVNIPTVGTIANGATVERMVEAPFIKSKNFVMNLHQGDFTTANRITEEINKVFGPDVAKALDHTSVSVRAPSDPSQKVSFMSLLENLEVDPAAPVAKVVINARTGTIVIGGDVRVTPAAVSHGSLTVKVNEDTNTTPGQTLYDDAGNITTATAATTEKDTEIEAGAATASAFVFDTGTSLSDIVDAINAIGTTSADLVAILEALRAAGALRAQMIII